MSALILPFLWATAGAEVIDNMPVTPGLAYYRERTEGLLRRYMRLSMEGGRAPSLLGRELCRGNVSHYRVKGFDDVVIFVHDVERCLLKLDTSHRLLVYKLAVEEYSQGDVVEMLGVPMRTLRRRYHEAIDAMTEVLLEAGMLESSKSCQEVENVILPLSR